MPSIRSLQFAQQRRALAGEMTDKQQADLVLRALDRLATRRLGPKREQLIRQIIADQLVDIIATEVSDSAIKNKLTASQAADWRMDARRLKGK